MMRRLALLLCCMAAGWGQPAAPQVKVCAIQGRWWSSPYAGQTVTTQGVVYADFDQTSQKRFYIQDVGCDPYPDTSDGLLVYLGQRLEVVQPGDLVQVTGLVQEYYGETELQAAPADVRILSRGQPLPPPQELLPLGDAAAVERYWEALEGMAVQVSRGRVVGPTASDGSVWLVAAAVPSQHLPVEDADAAAQRICVGGRGTASFPDAAVGDLAQQVAGALEYNYGRYCLALTGAPQFAPQPHPVEWPADSPFPRLLTWNVHNLFDTFDDPATQDTVLSAAQYAAALNKHAQALAQLGQPALIALQEVENQRVLQDLLLHPAWTRRYGILLVDGPDLRGLDVAVLYDLAQVMLLESTPWQSCTTLQDGLGPDGNQDPRNPLMAQTCDTNGDGVMDGNRLFARPILAVHVRLAIPGDGAVTWQPLWLLVVHLKSHTEDSFAQPYTLARRTQQAVFLAGLAQQLQSRSPGEPLLAAGDFNDLPAAASLAALGAAGLAPLSDSLPPQERYTYIYEGLSQVYDIIYANAPSALLWAKPQAVHFNADFPAALEGRADTPQRASDHDPLLVELRLVRSRLWLPVVSKNAAIP